MGGRYKKAAIIYLILAGLGVGAYFGIQVLKKGYNSTVSADGTDIFSAGQVSEQGPTGTRANVGAQGSQGQTQAGQRPTSQLLAEYQKDQSQTQANNQASAENVLRDSAGNVLDASQMAGASSIDTTANITPAPGNIKTPVNQSSSIDIKPQIDLSGGALGGSKTGGIDISGGIDLGSPSLSGGSGPKLDFSKVEIPGSGSAKKVTGTKSSPNPLTADMEKELKSLYYNSHNLSAAKAKAREILKLDPTNATAKRYMSIIKAEQRAMKYEDAGETEKALAEWKKILRWDPNNRWAKKGVSRNQ